MTLRLSALFDARCDAVRDAYIRSHANVHWTRGKSKQNKTIVDKTLDSSEDESRSTRPIKNFKKIVSPKKNNRSLIELTSKPLSKDTDTTQNGVSRVTRSMNNLNSYQNKDTSDSSSNSEEEDSTKLSLPKRTRSSKRMSRVRKRYGYDSDDNSEESVTKKDLTKSCLKRRYETETYNKQNKKLKLTEKKILQKRSSCRSKTAVNYCEEEYDVFDQILDRETRTELIDEISISESNSNEDSEESSLNTVVAISSRGRVRRVAKRFCE